MKNKSKHRLLLPDGIVTDRFPSSLGPESLLTSDRDDAFPTLPLLRELAELELFFFLN